MRKNLTVIILTAGALLAVFFFTLQIHQTGKGKILSQFNENQLQIARQTAREIESYLSSRSHDLRRLSSTAAQMNSDRKRMAVDIQSNFKHLKMVKINEISLLDEKGTVAYSTTAVAMGENHSQDNFFSWARDPVNKGSVWIGYEKADGRRRPVTAGNPASTHIVIFLVTPLYRESTTGGRQKPAGKFAGALMLKVDLEGMIAERSLLFTPVMKLHKLWVMDKDGTVLLHSEHPEMVMRNIREKDETCHQCHASFDHVETMLGKAEGTTEYQVKGNPRKAAAFASMSFGNASWIVVVNAPLDEVTAFEWKNLKDTLLLLGLVLFVLGIAFFLAYRNYREKADHETAINSLLNISLLNIRLEEQLAKMLEIITSIAWFKVEAKGCIFLVKEKSDVLVMAVQKGLSPSLGAICAEVPFGRCICGRAALTGEIVFANSVDGRHDNRYEGISPHGHYCVPIKFHDKVLGVLNLYLRAGHRRDSREEEFLKAITDVMAGVIERKWAEETLGESEEKYRWVLDNMADVITIMDMNLRFTYVTPSIMRMRGYTAEEATAQTLEQALTPESLQISAKVFEEEMKLEASGTADPGRSRILELEQYRKDGSIVWMENSLSFMRDKAQKPVGILSVSRDITDRKRAEEALRASEELFRSYLENAPDGVYMSDLEGNFLYGNRKCEEIIGYRREELIGKNFLELNILPENSLNKAAQLLQANIEGKPTGPDEIELISKEGRLIPVEINTSMVQRMGQGIVLAFVRDVTERKRAEEELQQTLESLRKAFGATIQAMVSAVESRDPYTAGHQIRSANLARTIATEMGLSHEKIEGIRVAGSIHDIGKLSIPAEILSKPTKLTEIEFSLIKEHARKGYEMLKDVESPWPLAEIVHQHHERMDGSGYPRNLKGEEILIDARILTVADVVEAMASHRPYRPGLGIDAALNEIEKNKGIFYDEVVADACLRLFREKGFQLATA